MSTSRTMIVVAWICVAFSCFHTFHDLNANERPNILWLTSEDNGPDLGCYGDAYATTPSLDQFAKRGLRYDIAWSNVPVCAPARTCLITGMYPCTIGAEHMRSMVMLDPQIKPFPIYLQQHGYFCTNNRKEDYNFKKPPGTWNESSSQAHWRNRKENQPFFAVFNHTITHESKIRNRPHKAIHDPAKVRVPAYHPDLPEVRQDWAQYYDRLTEMDAQVGKKLKQLEKDGLVDDTIVFYFADHGCGMPRHKRSVTNSGLHVPLLIFIPEKFKHLRPKDYVSGGSTKRMVAFVDFAPTVLSLAGIKPPEHIQGRAFLGEFETEPKEFLVGMRGRMDERIDFCRSIRNEQYIYIRNYLPHLPEGQYLHYQMQTPTTKAWYNAFIDGKLNKAQEQFWMQKPRQALFDLKNDPDQVNNLAETKEHESIALGMHGELWGWQSRNMDLGSYSEIALNRYGENQPIYEIHDGQAKSFGKRPVKQGQISALLGPELIGNANKRFSPFPLVIDLNGSPVFRFWEVNNYLIALSEKNGNKFSEKDKKLIVAELKKALKTEKCDEVAILECEIIALLGAEDEIQTAFERLIEYSNLDKYNVFTAVAALNAIDRLDKTAKPFQKQIELLPKKNENVHSRMDQLVPRLIEKIVDDLNAVAHQ